MIPVNLLQLNKGRFRNSYASEYLNTFIYKDIATMLLTGGCVAAISLYKIMICNEKPHRGETF